jgi:hypothetical protein
LIWALTAGCVTPSDCAALVKLRRSTTATNVRSNSVGILVMTLRPHGDSGCAGTATNWVVQVVIPTCGFRPPIRDYKQATTLWHLIFHLYHAKIAHSHADFRISAAKVICVLEQRPPRSWNLLARKRANVGAPKCSSIREEIPHSTAGVNPACRAMNLLQTHAPMNFIRLYARVLKLLGD